MPTKSKERTAWLLIWLVVVFVALVFGAYAWKVITKDVVGADNCIYEDKRMLKRKSADQTVLIVDQSEVFSESHRRQVKGRLLEYLADDRLLPVRSAIMLFVFGKNDFVRAGAGQTLVPMPSLCKPPSAGNEVIANEKKISRVFQNNFILPLNKAIDESLGVALGDRSPILEMIQYVSRSQDIKEDPKSPHQKTLIIVSDLLQHSENFTHYKPWTWDQYESTAAKSLRADLRNWNVRLLYVQRYGNDGMLQGKEHFEFWQRYFHAAGAKIASAERIP